ncbi:MAG: asparagine synthase-related protein, partial [Lysobacterales bacterium]
VAQRPKQGLRVPWRIYRTAALRDYFTETILETSRKSGLFDHRRLEPWVRRLAASPKQRAAQLWPICHFCLWWNRFIEGDAGIASAWTGDDAQ